MRNKTTRKKTYLLPQDLIETVQAIFETKTETEALVKAMEEVALRHQLSQWHLRNQGQLRFQNLYGR